MQITTIAIDDEPLALQLVESYVRKTPFLNLVATFDNPIDAIEFLNGNEVQLLLLDIQMPDLTGVEFVRTLTNPPKIVFTTAFEKYALESFKLNAVDYLLKPFSYEEFLRATNKVRYLIELENPAYTSFESTNKFLFLKSEHKVRRVNFNEINYIEGLKDYIKVYVQNEEKPILSLSSMKAIEQKLPSELFMRVHRSYIVNLGKVNVVERSRIVFGKTLIPVGDQFKQQFQQFLYINFL
jgi:DNA-binding LytR/AlgR family response regulator